MDATGFTASPWAYNGKVFALSEDGDTYVMQAGPEFKVLGKNSLGRNDAGDAGGRQRQRHHPHRIEAVSDREDSRDGLNSASAMAGGTPRLAASEASPCSHSS